MQILSAASSLNPGQDLWVLPDKESSRWIMRLDWYLNFQIHRASRHKSFRRSPELNQLLENVEWSLPEEQLSEGQPVLFSCEGHLPARWVALVPGSENLPRWVAKLHSLWQGLGEPRFRVFLPPDGGSAEFSAAWKVHSPFEDFTVVLDQEPRLTLA